MSAKSDILEQRITKRIEEMIHKSEGLQEIFELFKKFEDNQKEIDFEKGILQAIGYKEFYSFYNHIKLKYNERMFEIINKQEFDERDIELLKESKERLKQKTIQYTVYQIKWLNKRINGLFGNEPNKLLLKI